MKQYKTKIKTIPNNPKIMQPKNKFHNLHDVSTHEYGGDEWLKQRSL